MHEHNECEHELKYCAICDVVYCPNCGKEWVKKVEWTMTVSEPLTSPYKVYPNVTYHSHN